LSESYAKTTPLSFPGAVVLLIRKHSTRRGFSGRHAKQALRRWRGRYGGHFPCHIQHSIEAASQEVVNLIARGSIEARGTPRDENGNRQCEEPIDLWFLKCGVIANPLAEFEIRTDWMAEGGFGRQDRGYSGVYLDRDQFLEAMRVIDAVSNRSNEYGTRPALTGSPPAPAPIQAEPSRSAGTIKRKGGRHARWARHLDKHLRLGLKRGDDIFSLTLLELQTDFSSCARIQSVPNVPTSRSAVQEQIKRVLRQILAERQEREQRDPSPAPSLEEIMRPPAIRRE
jgi:hypothetical protein